MLCCCFLFLFLISKLEITSCYLKMEEINECRVYFVILTIARGSLADLFWRCNVFFILMFHFFPIF